MLRSGVLYYVVSQILCKLIVKEKTFPFYVIEFILKSTQVSTYPTRKLYSVRALLVYIGTDSITRVFIVARSAARVSRVKKLSIISAIADKCAPIDAFFATFKRDFYTFS